MCVGFLSSRCLFVCLLIAIVSLKTFAITQSDAIEFQKLVWPELDSRNIIRSFIVSGKFKEAQNEWKKWRCRISSNANRYQDLRRRLLDEDSITLRETLDDILFDTWTTNYIGGWSQTTYRDVLADPMIIQNRRKYHFDSYGLSMDVCEAYYSENIHMGGDDADYHFLIYFVPCHLGFDGYTKDGIIKYHGSHIENRKADFRRSEIANYVWANHTKYRTWFVNSLAARWFLVHRYEFSDDLSKYLDQLKLDEKWISKYVEKNGKIGLGDVCNTDGLIDKGVISPKVVRNWNYAQVIWGRVVDVIDGDTIRIRPYSRSDDMTIRLDKIDAPEKGQPFGREAKEYLSSWINNNDVRVLFTSKDIDGRFLGAVLIGDTYINLRLVSEGLAWHYKKYDNSLEFNNAERSARAYCINIWSDPNPIMPSDWRNRHAYADR